MAHPRKKLERGTFLTTFRELSDKWQNLEKSHDCESCDLSSSCIPCPARRYYEGDPHKCAPYLLEIAKERKNEMTDTYKIGNVCLRFKYIYDKYFASRIRSYKSDESPEYQMRVVIKKDLMFPEGKPKYRFQDRQIYEDGQKESLSNMMTKTILPT